MDRTNLHPEPIWKTSSWSSHVCTIRPQIPKTTQIGRPSPLWPQSPSRRVLEMSSNGRLSSTFSKRDQKAQVHHVKRPKKLQRKGLKRIVFLQRGVSGQPFPRQILIRSVKAEQLGLLGQRIGQLRQPEST